MIEVPELIAHEAAPAPLPKGAPRPWWEGRPFVAAMILIAFVPLLIPVFPPLVDLPGHMGRFKVALDHDNSASLRQFYDFHWKPIGNLGVDLLVVPLAKWLGVELATKLVVMSIPPLTVAGMLWVAREVHNRLPPTVAFALPLAFGHPFLYGFVNFALSMALAFLALGLWLRLGRKGRSSLRAALFVPISFVVFFAHTVGWGMMGLMIVSAEAVRQHDRGRTWWRAGLKAAWLACVMALPIAAMILWRTEASGGATGAWFDWHRKWDFLVRVLRDRWMAWDMAAAAVIYAVPLFALAHPRLTLSRNLAFSGLVLALAFAALPWKVFGSAYADMRMVPYIAAIFILGIRFQRETSPRLGAALAIAGVAFMLAKTATTTASLLIADRENRAAMAALDRVPQGARVAGFEWAKCRGWALERQAHLPGMAIVRREAFANDQWRLAGANLLSVRHAAGVYSSDPSQIVRSPGCRGEGWPYPVALKHIPAHAFDYVWLINVPADGVPGGAWRLVWQDGANRLYARAT